MLNWYHRKPRLHPQDDYTLLENWETTQNGWYIIVTDCSINNHPAFRLWATKGREIAEGQMSFGCILNSKEAAFEKAGTISKIDF